MVRLSVALGVLGVAMISAGWPHLRRYVPYWGPRQHWILGLAALFPAWLIAFMGLLPSSPGGFETSLPRPALFSSAAVLLGVIFTDGLARHLQSRTDDQWPLLYCLLGMAALIPGWFIALFSPS